MSLLKERAKAKRLHPERALKKEVLNYLFCLKFGPGEGLRPRRLIISEGRRGRTHWVRIPPQIFPLKKSLLFRLFCLKFGPGDSADEKVTKCHFWGEGKSEAIASRTGTKKEVLNYLFCLKFGPGGIRTHDQGIMSPLRYRCATGPWRLSIKLLPWAALPSSRPKWHLVTSSSAECHRPVAIVY